MARTAIGTWCAPARRRRRSATEFPSLRRGWSWCLLVLVRWPSSGRRSGHGEGRAGDVRGRAAVRLDATAVRQQLTRVVEHDDAVAEKAPPLLGERGDDARGVVVGRFGGWTGGGVAAH